MKITEIQIERFGVWSDLTLPLADSGLNVFYGPNEAGKTTLLRFIRGVLFGFSPRVFDGVAHDVASMAGGLQVFATGEPIQLHRGSGEVRGRLTCSGARGSLPADEMVARLLCGIDENVFERLFAVGTREMQELGTLTDDSVAEHIYGLTLGPTGQRLLAACERVRTERQQLIDPLQQQGELVDLFERLDQIESQLNALHTLKRKHGELAGLRDELDDKIAGVKQRQAGIAEQLRGHTFLERAWGPWHRIRECDTELDELPTVADFPEQGLDKLKQLDTDIATATQSRDRLVGQSRQLRTQVKQLPIDGRLRQHGPALRSLIDQRNWIIEQQQRVATAQRGVAESDLALKSVLDRLGSYWTASRLDTVDTTPAASYRIASLARSLQSAESRRQQLQRTDERLTQSIRKRQEKLRELIQSLPGATLDDALAAARKQLDNLTQLSQLRLHEAELLERQDGIDEHRERIAPHGLLPDWVTSLLWVFGLVGGVLGVWGLYTGHNTSTVAGAIYALLGMTCGGLAWGLRTQFEGDVLERLAELNDDSARNLAELRATREAIRHLGGEPRADIETPSTETPTRLTAVETPQRPIENDDLLPSHSIHDDNAWRPSAFWRWDARMRRVGDWFKSVAIAIDHGFDVVFDFLMDEASGITSSPLPSGVGSGVRAVTRSTLPHPSPLPEGEGASHAPDLQPLAELEQIREITQRICELERWDFARRRLKRTGKRLAALKQQLAIAHREVGTTRQSWQELIGPLGLPADVKIETALDTWRQLADATERRRQLHAARAEFDHHQQLLRSVVQRIEEQARRMNVGWTPHPSDKVQERTDEASMLLTTWEQQLTANDKLVLTRRDLRSRIRVLRKEAREYRTLLDDLNVHRGALLVCGGAATTEEFTQRARWAARRTFLEDQSADARHDLEAICQNYPDLAVVEDDMEVYDAEQNTHAIEVCEQEADDLDRDLALTHERLGGIKHELSQLEQDRRPADLRIEREQVLTRLRHAAGRWFAWETAAQGVEELRSRYERTCQPATLADASRFLARLTCGKYKNVWTPLGQRHLRVDDEHGHSLPVESLSRGTREQLFLSVRLAVVQNLARRGINLPLVLDDVFVNFDERRAEAAVELLLDFVAQQHQVLVFTCHQHLAALFESKGVDPIWLPAHSLPLTEQPPRRLAG
ncbi:MAG: AAA family ATPase [Planctomycetales bacterium]|nr:AAA family ATPase [Planctomycetales bacterium]